MTSTIGTTRRRKSATKIVDCEKCKHFCGKRGFATFEWGCQKGHPAESKVLLTRVGGCADYKQLSRDELIFRRFKAHAVFHGNERLKNLQSQVRRTASGLSSALDQFGDLMDSEQAQAARDAIKALNGLANDVERASGMAKAFKAQQDREREAERCRKLDELAARLLDGWSADQVVECAKHLAAFDSRDGHQWLRDRHGRSMIMSSGLWAPNSVAHQFERASSEARKTELLAQLRRDLAENLDALATPISRDYATRADFDAYTQLLRDRAATRTSVAAVVADAARQAGEPDHG